MSVRESIKKIRTIFLVALFFILTGCPVVLHAQDDNRFLVAQSYEQAGDMQHALAIYEDLYLRWPENVIYYQTLAGALINAKKYERGIELVSKMPLTGPDDFFNVAALGKLYYLAGQDKKCFELWDNYLIANNKNPHLCRAIAGAATDIRVFERTVQYLRWLKEQSAEKKGPAYEIANILTMTMDYAGAAREYSFILHQDVTQLPSIEGRVQQVLGRPEAVQAFLQVFGQDCSDIPGIEHTLAILYIENKDYLKAFELLKKHDKLQHQQGVELFNYALRLSGLGRFEDSRKVFEYLFTLQGNTAIMPVVKLNYAKVEEQILTRTAQGNTAWKPLAVDKALKRADYTRVLALYKEIIAAYRQSEPAIEALVKTGTIYLQTGNYDSARVFLQQVVKYYAMSAFFPDACLQLARLSAAEKHIDSSLFYYEKILVRADVKAKTANEARYLKALYKTRAGQMEEARQILSGLIDVPADDRSNDALELSMLLNTAMNDSAAVMVYAGVLLQAEQGELSGAVDKLQQLKLAPEQFYLKSLVEILIVQIKIAFNDYGEAIAKINEINTQKSNIFADEAQFYLGQVYNYGLHDVQAALKAYETFLEVYPSSIYTAQVREEVKKLKAG
ncbi:MAG: tetratricopeptide repeat protein [Ignavibacteria bacterium]|nr:tetratricopeptide repeat protein [Ignavibacteria bacterium]